MPSNNGLSADGQIIKLGDVLRIDSGTSGNIGFFSGSTSNMNYDGELHISSKITSIESDFLNANVTTLTAYNATVQKNLHIENNLGKTFSIRHVNDEILFYGATNNNLTPSSYIFATNAGGSDADIKLKIHKDKDEVEVKDLHVTNAIKVSELLNIYYQAGPTLHEATISREPNSVKYIGDKSDTGGAHLEFYTDDGTDVKLKIYRDSSIAIVEVKNLTVTDDILSTTLYSTFIYADEIDSDEVIVNNLLTSEDVLVNNEIEIGTDSKIWSSSTTYQFQSGTSSSPKQFKFMTGAPGEVVYFKSGFGTGVIETDSLILNGNDIEIELTLKQNLLVAGSNINISALDVLSTVDNLIFLSSCTAGSSKMWSSGTTALFGNRVSNNWQDSCIIQWGGASAGSTFINTPINREIEFRQGGTSTMAKIDSSGDFFISRNGSLSKINDIIDLKQDLLTSSSDLNINELELGSDSKIWSSSSTFQFRSGTPTSQKQFKFMSGSPGEVVYFLAGLDKGVIQTDSII